MKSNVVVLVVVLAGCSKQESPSPTAAAPSVVPSAAPSQAPAAPAASQPVDESVFTNAAARTFTGRIADATGKAAPAIVFVKAGLPAKKYPAPTGHVTIDQRDKVERFARDLGMNYPVLLGAMDMVELSRRAGNRLGALPFTIVMDRTGAIVSVEIGVLKEAKLEAMLRSLL